MRVRRAQHRAPHCEGIEFRIRRAPGGQLREVRSWRARRETLALVNSASVVLDKLHVTHVSMRGERSLQHRARCCTRLLCEDCSWRCCALPCGQCAAGRRGERRDVWHGKDCRDPQWCAHLARCVQSCCGFPYARIERGALGSGISFLVLVAVELAFEAIGEDAMDLDGARRDAVARLVVRYRVEGEGTQVVLYALARRLSSGRSAALLDKLRGELGEALA